jgi:hypothetical protein
MIDNHTPIEPNKFGGLYARGTFNDNVPRDHFIDSLNTIGTGSEEVRTRYGFTLGITKSNLRRARRYQKEGEATRVLLLNSSGELYDATASLVTPILTVVGMTDFSLVVAYNRAYISPNNGVTGLSGEYVYVYTGSGTARRAAGAAPVAGFNVAVSATAGNIEPGTHLFAWCFETDSGFITPPNTGIDLAFDGTKAVDFNNVPTGPAGTAARRLIASRAIQNYNGNVEGYEMFFVSGGRIADNVTTVLTAVNFFDADLQISADYTYDQLETIPAALFMGSFGTRLVYGGENANRSMARISNSGEPESVNELSGFLVFDPNETEGIKACVEWRNNLYITKGNPGKTYATSDNGYDPSTWAAPAIDGSVGADYNGIAVMVSPQSASAAMAFFSADISGIFMFDGAYRSTALTYKIESIWQRINKAVFYTTQIVLEGKNSLIYALVALDSATTPSHILVGDYKEGLDPKNIVWHIWAFTSISPVSIFLDINNTTKKTYLRVAGYAGNIYDESTSVYNDNSVAYESYVKFALMNLLDGYVHQYAALRVRVKGSGTLLQYLYSEDDVSNSQLVSVTLAAAPGKEYMTSANFTNEKAAVKLRVNTINHHFELHNFILYAQAMWATRPQ